MKFGTPLYMSGYLLESPTDPVTTERLTNCDKIKFVYHFSKANNWELYEFVSNIALAGEGELGLEGPFSYPLVCRRSGKRVLILSIDRDVIDYLITKIFAKNIRPRFRNVPIAVHELVTHISNKPQRYVLSYVHARVAGYGDALKSSSFYGEDIGEAEFFRNNLYLFSCYTCGLKNITAGKELIRISAEGFISFYYSSEFRLIDIQKILNYISQLGFLGRQPDDQTDIMI